MHIQDLDKLKKENDDKYCPRERLRRLKDEYVNLKVKGTDVISTTNISRNWPLMCVRDAIEMATELMDKKISTLAKRQAKNKRKLDNNNQAQQQSPKRQNVAQAYIARTCERNEYDGTLPLCNKCKFHHNGSCTAKLANCKKAGHLTRDCWNLTATSNQRTITCYECGDQGHYRSDCLKLKNQNHGNQAENTEAHGMVYALGGGDIDQDPNNIEDETED
ncbi:reverse transcriptase domain-containing protein [Tanacetum coccineum]